MLVILSTIMVETNISECSIGERLGRNIKQCRAALGLTQAQLAAAVGVTPGAVGQYEIGANRPSLKTALALAAALGCTVDDLYREEVKQDA